MRWAKITFFDHYNEKHVDYEICKTEQEFLDIYNSYNTLDGDSVIMLDEGELPPQDWIIGQIDFGNSLVKSGRAIIELYTPLLGDKNVCK
jgi:hypothetical protein